MIETEYAEAIKTLATMCRDIAQNTSCYDCDFYNTKKGCYFSHHIPLEYTKVINEEHTVVYKINEENIEKW